MAIDFEHIDISNFSDDDDIKSHNDQNTNCIMVREIISIIDCIYMGKGSSAYHKQELLDEEIRCILCLDSNTKTDEILAWYRQHNIIHYQLSINNRGDFNISKYWDEIYNIISDSYRRHTHILIHDEHCISRAPTAVIYWVMRESFTTDAYKDIPDTHNGIVLDYTINQIRGKKFDICPNKGFINHLRTAELYFQNNIKN